MNRVRSNRAEPFYIRLQVTGICHHGGLPIPPNSAQAFQIRDWCDAVNLMACGNGRKLPFNVVAYASIRRSGDREMLPSFRSKLLADAIEKLIKGDGVSDPQISGLIEKYLQDHCANIEAKSEIDFRDTSMFWPPRLI